MRKLKLCSLILFTLILACSDNNESEKQINEDFSIEIEFLTDKLEVDQPISFKLKSNKNIISYSASTNNINFVQSNQSNYGKNVNIILSFDKTGKNTIYLSAQNEKNEILKKEFEIDILKGESVKIKNLKIISFKNINQTWDSEYSNNDINRLADLKFTLEKTYIKTSLFNEVLYERSIWYKSETLINQGNLNWNLNNENLNVNPNFIMTFSLADIDDNGLVEDLLLGPPFAIEFNFKDYIQDKPNKVILKKENIDLEVEFEIEW
ncbi:hypothetical protein [Polaribacter cellanae]|uniref:Lipoprotein n=1 Tax=Polaribacter cellanae TaxID=2818493 RepID=A0A975CLD3_9FLAO|nr:hypothetical protein [Polaribacter cellanae]QTE21788.1 hypothetical protein J3359_13320 [Polaribacter cellanae]